jgi:hypothetical protein
LTRSGLAHSTGWRACSPQALIHIRRSQMLATRSRPIEGALPLQPVGHAPCLVTQRAGFRSPTSPAPIRSPIPGRATRLPSRSFHRPRSGHLPPLRSLTLRVRRPPHNRHLIDRRSRPPVHLPSTHQMPARTAVRRHHSAGPVTSELPQRITPGRHRS